MNPEPPPAKPRERFPSQVKYIVGTEACERFSFYGMYGIITLYLSNHLLTGPGAESHAKEIVHLFVTAMYFLPLVGGYLADRWWGRYHTILYISLFYCLGHGTLALYGHTLPGVCTGLAFIALGAGGIKPCVAAFMGDQFRADQPHLLTKAYGWYYWAVNFGSLFGFTVIPATRDHYGYGWAFGIPGIFMGVATLVFWLGRKHYVRVLPAHKAQQAGFLEIIWHCLKSPAVAGEKFFDRARGRFTPQEVEGARAVFGIILVFLPISIFWALYFQVNTSWVQQGERMSPFYILGYKVDSETIQSAGALLVLIWVPVMTMWLYPLAERLGLRPTPLRRITLGLILSAASFGFCSLLQQHVDRHETLTIAWQLISYTILEAGEVLVSATALEFAFGQAPPAMKSTIMSFWFLTSSLGNLVVAAITWLNGNFVKASGAAEYRFYALLMLFGTVIFVAVAAFYRYRQPPPPATEPVT